MPHRPPDEPPRPQPGMPPNPNPKPSPLIRKDLPPFPTTWIVLKSVTDKTALRKWQHVEDQAEARTANVADRVAYRDWAESRPLVPRNTLWYKRFNSICVVGKGDHADTTLAETMAPREGSVNLDDLYPPPSRIQEWYYGAVRYTKPKKAKLLQKQAAAADIPAIVREFMGVLEPGLPVPVIKVVNHTGSRWLGRDIYDPKLPGNTKMELQKSIVGDDKTLRRILAHECCHHQDFLVNWEPLSPADKRTERFLRRDGHGPQWQAIAALFNARYGADFVTRTSDEAMVVEGTNEFFVLMRPKPGAAGTLWFSMAVRPSPKQKKRIEDAVAAGGRLFRSKDSVLAHAPKIGDGWGSARPTDTELKEKLQRIWDEGEQVPVKTPDTSAYEDAVVTAYNALMQERAEKAGQAEPDNGSVPAPKEAAKPKGKLLGVESPEFKAWFSGSHVVNEDGSPCRVFRGDYRGDRIGPAFKKHRNTSGRFYFTSDPEIASSYATNKPDAQHQEENQDYANWFRFPKYKSKGERNAPDLKQLWWRLNEAERARVKHVIENTSHDDQSELQFDSGHGIAGNMEEYGRRARGNWLAVAEDLWLTSGAIFDEEEKFGKLLDAMGLDYEFDNPHEARSMVTAVYLKITNPLDTSNIPSNVVNRFRELVKGTRTKYKPGDAQWDKGNYSVRDWVDKLEEDLKEGTTYAWTVMPEKITQTLQQMGYDGVKDTGGKMGGDKHIVWIAFEPHQIKSATGNSGKYDSGKDSIIASRKNAMQVPDHSGDGMIEVEDPKTPYDKACCAVALDDEMWHMLVDYVSCPDGFDDNPKAYAKLIALIKKIPAFVPPSSRGCLYRGEPFRPGDDRLPAKWEGSHRPVLSWSLNYDTAKYFADGRDAIVWCTVGKIKGIALGDIVHWRNITHQGESHHSGSQAEWFVLSTCKAKEARPPNDKYAKLAADQTSIFGDEHEQEIQERDFHHDANAYVESLLELDLWDALQEAEGDKDAIERILGHHDASKAREFPGGYVATVDDSVVVVQSDTGSTHLYKDANDFVTDADLDTYFPDAEDRFNTEFWESPATLYHATDFDNLRSIMKEGLGTASNTRGLSNRGVGAAVFTTSEQSDLDDGAYGDGLLSIDTQAMAADGYQPYVSQEPDILEGELRGALAHSIGLDDYNYDWESGISPYTVIVNGGIPAKYLHVESGEIEDDEEEPPAKKAKLLQKQATGVTASRNWEDMFKEFIRVYNAEATSQNFPVSQATAGFEMEIKWAKKTFKQNPRWIAWWLRWVRLELEYSYDNIPGIVELFKRDFKPFQAAGVTEGDVQRFGNSMNSFHRQWEHMMSLPLPVLEKVKPGFREFTEVISECEPFEKKWQENRGSKLKPQTDDEIYLKFPDGSAWWLLNRSSCKEEGDAMGHCGNSADAKDGQRILSYRVPKKGGYWEPHCTFILDTDGNLGEMKGRNNDKPVAKYFPFIIDLLKTDLVKGIVGGGYAAENNFSMKDLSPEQQDELGKVKPRLLPIDKYYEQAGVDDWVIGRVKKAYGTDYFGYYDKEQKFMFGNWADMERLLEDRGGHRVEDFQSFGYYPELEGSEIYMDVGEALERMAEAVGYERVYLEPGATFKRGHEGWHYMMKAYDVVRNIAQASDESGDGELSYGADFPSIDVSKDEYNNMWEYVKEQIAEAKGDDGDDEEDDENKVAKLLQKQAAIDPNYYMVEGCGIFAVALARLNGGTIYAISDPDADPFHDVAEMDTDELDERGSIGELFDWNVTHVYCMAPDGCTYDIKGKRTPQQMAADFQLDLEYGDVETEIGPYSPEAFIGTFMGDSDAKPLYGTESDIEEVTQHIKEHPETYGLKKMKQAADDTARYGPEQYTVDECVSFAYQNEAQTAYENGVRGDAQTEAALQGLISNWEYYADEYRVPYDVFKAELKRRDYWEEPAPVVPKKRRPRKKAKLLQKQAANEQPESGPYGPIFHEFTDKPMEAIEKLISEKGGEVPGVWYHPVLGWIDLIWGNEEGGLAHIIAKHVEGQKDLKLIDLAEMIPYMKVVRRDGMTARLESADHEAGVKLEYFGEAKRWLVTAYEKPKKVPIQGSILVLNSKLAPSDGHPPSGTLNSVLHSLKQAAAVRGISLQEARDRKLFGPVYHGTTESNRETINQEGFKYFEEETGSASTSHGYGTSEYAQGAPPPIHHLGFGVYLTTSKAIATKYNGGSAKGLTEYYIDAPNMATINFGAPNTMMKWWVQNGYDTALAKTDRVAATRKLTEGLKSKYEAVWFKGRGIRSLLDGDQVVVFDPDRIYKIDKGLSQPGDIGSTVIRKADGMKGVLVGIREMGEQFRQYHGGAERFLEVKWQKGGRDANVYDRDVEFPETKKKAKLLIMADMIEPLNTLYHVTYQNRLSSIATQGLITNAPSSMAVFDEAPVGVFLTEESGIDWWVGFAEDYAQQYDSDEESRQERGLIPIILRVNVAGLRLKEDKLGRLDSGSGTFYSETDVDPGRLQIQSGGQWGALTVAMNDANVRPDEVKKAKLLTKQATPVTEGLDWRTPVAGLTVSLESLAKIEPGLEDMIAEDLYRFFGVIEGVDPKRQVPINWVEPNAFEPEDFHAGMAVAQKVEAIADLMAQGHKFSPAFSCKKMWRDGNHRVKAAARIGILVPSVDIHSFLPDAMQAERKRQEEQKQRWTDEDQSLYDELTEPEPDTEPKKAKLLCAPETAEMRVAVAKTALNIPNIKKLFGKKVCDRIRSEQMSAKNESDDDVFDGMMDVFQAIDPSPTKEYVFWATSNYAKGTIKRYEDLGSRVMPALERFDQLKKSKKLPVEQRDIMKLKGLNALEELVDQYKDVETTSNREKDTQIEKDFFKSGDALLIYNDAEMKVIVPKTQEASCFFGVNTKWCTAAKENNMFSRYAEYGDLYIVLFKAENKRYQFNFETSQFMDEKDEPINALELADKHPILWKVFSPIAEKLNSVVFNVDPSLEIQIKSVRRDPLTIRYIKDPAEVVQQNAADRSGQVLQFIADPSDNVQFMAIRENANSIKYIKNPSEARQIQALERDLHSYRWIEQPAEKATMYLVKTNPLMLKMVANPSEEVQMAAVELSGDTIQYIDDPSEEVQLASLGPTGRSLTHIKWPSEAVQLAGVSRNGMLIGNVGYSNGEKLFEPSEAVQLAAVKQNGRAIQFLKNPSPAVQEASRQALARSLEQPEGRKAASIPGRRAKLLQAPGPLPRRRQPLDYTGINLTMWAAPTLPFFTPVTRIEIVS